MRLRREDSFTKDILIGWKSAGLEKESMTEETFLKTASKKEPEVEKTPNRIKVASAEGKIFMKTASTLDRNFTAAEDGSIWGIETDPNGEQWLVRNDFQSELVQVAQSLI